MASELIVQTIQGPSSGANANKVLIPSGHTLDVSGGTLVPSAGAVVQVVESTTTQSTVISTANTFHDVGHSLSITPTSAASKIYLSHFSGGIGRVSGSSFGIRLLRDGVVQEYNDRIGYSSDASYWSSVNWSCIFYDSPATTSQVTYTLEITCLSNAASSGLRYNDTNSVSSNIARFIAMEIAQ